jgi:hypothetical protein
MVAGWRQRSSDLALSRVEWEQRGEREGGGVAKLRERPRSYPLRRWGEVVVARSR